MKNTHLSDFLGGSFWPISSHTIQVFGVEMALFIHNLFDWRTKLKEDGMLGEDDFFYLRQDSIEKRTKLSVDKQRRFISILGPSIKRSKNGEEVKIKGALDMLEIERRGAPPLNFYRIDTDKLIMYIENQVRISGLGNTRFEYCETQPYI